MSLDLSKKQKQFLGASGISLIVLSWAFVILAPRFGYSSIDVGFRLTIFYVLVWLSIKMFRRYNKKKEETE